MSLSWENSLGKNPSLYAKKVLNDCGLRVPPICERTMVDYLGLELKEFSKEDAPENEDILEIIKNDCAWLQRNPNGKSCIWVHRDTRLERRRLSVFHECGHAILPWHDKFNYFCDEKDLDPTVRSRIEREAFRCGSEFLMPREMFVDDILSLETNISAIEQLQSRYVASMEATAIWYAYSHPGLCGIVMVEKSNNHTQEVIVKDQNSCGQLILPFKTPPKRIIHQDNRKFPINVKYFVKSHRFPKFIRPGTRIEEGNLVFEAWDSWKPMQGEIQASVFRSLAKWAYNAECLPLGNTGRLLVLLWLPDRHLKFNLRNGVML